MRAGGGGGGGELHVAGGDQAAPAASADDSLAHQGGWGGLVLRGSLALHARLTSSDSAAPRTAVDMSTVP